MIGLVDLDHNALLVELRAYLFCHLDDLSELLTDDVKDKGVLVKGLPILASIDAVESLADRPSIDVVLSAQLVQDIHGLEPVGEGLPLLNQPVLESPLGQLN